MRSLGIQRVRQTHNGLDVSLGTSWLVITRQDRLRRAWRKLKASWRDTLLLLREFRWALVLFFAAVILCGLMYYALATVAGEAVASPIEAVYLVLTMTFLQPSGTFPHAWYLAIFHFLMPVLGLAILAQGLSDFGVMLFNRRLRGKEWEMAVASTFNNHIVLVGLGHLGFRIARHLRDMGEDVVVVDLNPENKLVHDARGMGIPVIHADGTSAAALEAAGVSRARTIQLCTKNDAMNMQMAFKARAQNPGIRVVLRIFDDELAACLHQQFGFEAMSATGMAAPVFAGAAAGVEMTGPLTIEGEAVSMARAGVHRGSPWVGQTVGKVEEQYELSIVVLRREGKKQLHPPGDTQLKEGDLLAVLGAPDKLNEFARQGR